MNNYVDIQGLDKARVFAALCNAATPHMFTGEMTTESARHSLAHANLFTEGVTYGWRDRRFTLDLRGETFDPAGYDKFNGGPGSAQKIIDQLRQESPQTDESV